MKSVFLLLIFLVIGVTLIMCSGEKKQEAQEEVEQTVVADSATCPGCEMKMDKAQMVAHEVEGEETQYFCSEECKTNYLAKKEEEAKAEPEAN
jgi:YHS domain-containing protein